MSELFKEVEKILGFRKVNTTAYHPQTDGLVEHFNRTLIAMLAKTSKKGGRDWDRRLPYVLFAYRAAEQQSTLESPFFLLYGRDPRLPTEAALCPEETKKLVNLREYGSELAECMSTARKLAKEHIKTAQKHQKAQYDRKARPPKFLTGDRVFLYKPAEKSGEGRKLARPYHGPYRIIELNANNAQIRKVNQPDGDLLLVATDRLRRCPDEVEDMFWPPDPPTKENKGAASNKKQDKKCANKKLRAASSRRGKCNQ